MPEDLDGKEEDTEQLFVLREGGEGAGEEREGEGMEVRRGRGEGLRPRKRQELMSNVHHVLETPSSIGGSITFSIVIIQLPNY